MKKRFILLIDVKEESKTLLRFAGNWAGRVDAELLIIQQVYSMAPGIGEGEIRSKIKRHEREKALTELTDFVANELDTSVTVRFYVTTGSLEIAIHKLHTSQMLDIIFVGMKNKSWLERLFFQSTAIRLYQEVKKPIVVLPLDCESNDFDCVQIAVTPRFPVNEEALRQVLSVTAAFGKKVILFSVLKPHESDEEVTVYLNLLLQIFPEYALSYEIVRNEDVVRGITKQIETGNGLLIVQKGSREFSDYFRSYIVEDLIQLSKAPVVILP
ncbi:MAG TPA: universal stress protein [Flavipsychrobacter sp.]|nr:universal stress protein [Flavipsychrobacter sp.]